MTKPSVGVFLAFFFIVPLVIATAAGSDAVDATNCPTCGDKPFDYNSTPGAVDSAPAAAVPRSIGGDVTQVTKTEDGITFRADTGPDLDLWQPCDGGDRRITFTIDASELAPALERTEIKRATLKLRAWDVDPLGNPVVPECLHEVDHVYFNNRLLAQVLTGADGQWSTPTFEIDPNWVEEGGNTVLVTIDDLGTTCWCLKVDWGELYIEFAPYPEFEKIEVSPNIPVTGEKITFDATVTPKDGYEISGFEWHLTDIKSGKELIKAGSPTEKLDPWYYSPLFGGYGDHRVVCRAFATYTKTGKKDILIGEKTLDFKIFFPMVYRWRGWVNIPYTTGWATDPDNEGEPNWLHYWKKDRAINGIELFGWDSSASGGSFHDPRTYNLGRHGASYWPQFSGVPDGLGPYKGFVGIETTTATIYHEYRHGRIWNEWQTGGAFVGLLNDDGNAELLPNDFETGSLNTSWAPKGSGTDPRNPDTFGLGSLWNSVYSSYGDEELMCWRAEKEALGLNAIHHDRDWSDIGAMAKAQEAAGPLTASASTETDFPFTPIMLSSSGETGFTGSFSDAGIDTNGNGLYDTIRVTAGVAVNVSRVYTVKGILSDGGGNESAIAYADQQLEPGTYTVNLDFEARLLQASGARGPLLLAIEISDGLEKSSAVHDRREDIPMQVYALSQLEGSQVSLSGSYSDTTTDPNADGVDDYLDVSAGLTVAHPGTYTILAALYAGTEQIATTSNAVGPGTGAQTVTLRFDGATIATNRQNGPYRLRSVAIVDDRGLSLDYADDPYGTAAYQWTQFLPNSLSFRAPFTDRGLDANGDGLFDQLAVDVVTDVTAAGEYTFTSVLVHNETGGVITQGSNVVVLGTGAQTVPLAFDGGEIFSRGQNGPYRLASLTVYDEAGRIAATANNLHTTGTYTFSDFRHSDITLGDHSDRGVDTNSNGYYDSLVVQFNVTVPKAGEYAINARLLAPDGAEVQWVGLTESLAAETPAMITMTFDGRLIHGAGQSGTFSLGDLSIYRNDSTGAPLYVTTAFSTNAYEYSQFESTTTIKGTIVSAFNAWPVKNANVYVTGVASATTDAAGRYILNVLKPGTYAVRVEPPARYGLSSTSESVTVDSSGAATHDFTLFSTGLPAPTINAIVPNTNVQGGVLTITVTGAGFVNDPTLLLSRAGSADIAGSISSVTATSIEGTFNLTGAVAGAWDVIVTNPDGQRAIKAGGFTVNGGTTPDPARFRFAPPSLKVPKGGTNATTLYLDTLTTGLAGFNITLALSLPDPAIGEIVDVTLPGWAIHSNSSLPADSVWIRAADLANITGPGGDALIGTVTIRGDSFGQTELRITQVWIDDERGRNVPAQLAVCTVNVMPSVLSVPGGTGLPTDPDTDRLYEDVNGNGRKDFADVVLYFNQMSWIAANEPVPAFDYNGNGRIDFADVVWLFNNL